MRVRDRIGSVRPRRSTVVLVLVVAVGAGGVSWAATRAAGPGVITACVDPAGGALMYSASGSCTSGQTTVQWNQQGPQGLEGPQGQTGPQGPPGAAATSGSGVVAFGPQSYKTGFSISAEIDKPGAYVADGSVDTAITPNKPHATFVAACSLFTGPPNGTATRVALWNLKFVYNKKTKTFKPSSANGPVDINASLSLGTGDVPLEVYFTCHSLFSVWSHPTITIETATNPSFHTVVGAALPNRPRIGPGPLKQVFGR